MHCLKWGMGSSGDRKIMGIGLLVKESSGLFLFQW